MSLAILAAFASNACAFTHRRLMQESGLPAGNETSLGADAQAASEALLRAVRAKHVYAGLSSQNGVGDLFSCDPNFVDQCVNLDFPPADVTAVARDGAGHVFYALGNGGLKTCAEPSPDAKSGFDCRDIRVGYGSARMTAIVYRSGVVYAGLSSGDVLRCDVSDLTSSSLDTATRCTTMMRFGLAITSAALRADGGVAFGTNGGFVLMCSAPSGADICADLQVHRLGIANVLDVLFPTGDAYVFASADDRGVYRCDTSVPTGPCERWAVLPAQANALSYCASSEQLLAGLAAFSMAAGSIYGVDVHSSATAPSVLVQTQAPVRSLSYDGTTAFVGMQQSAAQYNLQRCSVQPEGVNACAPLDAAIGRDVLALLVVA